VKILKRMNQPMSRKEKLLLKLLTGNAHANFDLDDLVQNTCQTCI